MTTLAERLQAEMNAEKAAHRDSPPHLIVEARAGTGKTTTLIEGLKIVKGLGSNLTPSEQQAAVWQSMELSRNARSVCFVAFNRSIATELQERVPAGCMAMTMHSMGFKAVQGVFGRVAVNQYRVQDIISEIDGRDIREIRKFDMTVLKATEDLVGLCKMNLLEGSAEECEKLASHYGVELNGSSTKVFALVPKVIERCKDVAKDRKIDFNDMVWLPVVLGLPVARYDLLLVDEAQDLNRCQQALAKSAGDRLILCGDPRQAIYGFAGADAESMPRMGRELAETDRGCQTLPLTVTRRCGKAIVAEANTIVPDFDAFETNSDGIIMRGLKYAEDEKEATDGAAQSNYRGYVEPGDMILCRVNAPLVSQCFKFLRAGKRANIQGRDIGQGLISTVKKLNADSLVDLISKLSDWLHNETTKENNKRNPSETRLIALQDRFDCLMAFTDDQKTVEEVITRIETIFTDERGGSGIKLSSIHKAKGLEARRVFFLTPKGAECPHPMAKSAWQREQEMNLRYVAITRAIETLVYVS